MQSGNGAAILWPKAKLSIDVVLGRTARHWSMCSIRARQPVFSGADWAGWFASAPSAAVPPLDFSRLARTVGPSTPAATVRIAGNRPQARLSEALAMLGLACTRTLRTVRTVVPPHPVDPEAAVLRPVSAAMSRNSVSSSPRMIPVFAASLLPTDSPLLARQAWRPPCRRPNYL